MVRGTDFAKMPLSKRFRSIQCAEMQLLSHANLASLQPFHYYGFVFGIQRILTKTLRITRALLPWLFLLSVLIGGMVVYGVWIHVPRVSAPHLHESPTSLASSPVTVVFGAGVYGERPSRVLARSLDWLQI